MNENKEQHYYKTCVTDQILGTKQKGYITCAKCGEKKWVLYIQQTTGLHIIIEHTSPVINSKKQQLKKNA